MAKGQLKSRARLEVLQGTLDLMVLQTLDSMGPLHSYGIARRIEQVSEDILMLNEGRSTRRSCGCTAALPAQRATRVEPRAAMQSSD